MIEQQSYLEEVILIKDHLKQEELVKDHASNFPECVQTICECYPMKENPEYESCWTIFQEQVAILKSIRDELDRYGVIYFPTIANFD